MLIKYKLKNKRTGEIETILMSIEKLERTDTIGTLLNTGWELVERRVLSATEADK
jgi:hypothetical protein